MSLQTTLDFVVAYNGSIWYSPEMDQITAMLDKLQRRIDELRERKRSFDLQSKEVGQQIAVAEAKMAGINQTVEIMKTLVPATALKEPVARKRVRRLTGHWQQIMQAAVLFGEFGYADLAKIAHSIGHEVGGDTLRSQMSGYKASGLVESAGPGLFVLTDAGKAAAGIDESGAIAPKENEAPSETAGASDAGHGSAPTQPQPWYHSSQTVHG